MGIMSMSTVVGLLAATLVVAPAPAEESAWIVETVPGAVETVSAIAEDLGGEPVETFDDAFTGVAVELTDAEAGMLEQRSDVVAVHPDVEMTLFDTQTSAPWHLSRLDQAAAPADGGYSYPASAGAGVRVYIVDSGISPNAGQLGSRLLRGVSALAGDSSTADCQGHGTHVAGIVASITYGVAKKASVVPVRVFSCSGSTSSSTVISGLNWIAANHPAGTPGVVNMSLGGSASSPLDSAVQNLINRGMIVTVAAGNGGADRIGDDACFDSPARVPAALTVGATTTPDARAAYSNSGTCLDLFAPGRAVRSLSHSSASSSVMMSGTSMAAPVVAGVAALAWGEAPGTSARQVESTVTTRTRSGVVSSAGSGSPNRLASSDVAVSVAAPTLSALNSQEARLVSGSVSGTLPFGTTRDTVELRLDDREPIIAPVDSAGGWRITLPSLPAGAVRYELRARSGSLASEPVSGTWLNVSMDRLDGGDRYAAAASISRAGFPEQVDRVFIATGATFPDALTAGPVASVLGGPLLLVPPSRLPAEVAAELDRLAPRQIVIVGGEQVVSPEVEEALAEYASDARRPVIRINGADRYETSRLITATGFDSARKVYVVTGQNYPDAMTASAVASSEGAPVILVRGVASTSDASTRQFLRDLGVEEIVIVGGSVTVSSGIEASLRTIAPVTRIGGADRFEVSRGMNAQAFEGASEAYLAHGYNFPDALAGSVLAGGADAPMYITPRACTPSYLLQQMADLGVTSVTILGGASSVGVPVEHLTRC